MQLSADFAVDNFGRMDRKIGMRSWLASAPTVAMLLGACSQTKDNQSHEPDSFTAVGSQEMNSRQFTLGAPSGTVEDLKAAGYDILTFEGHRYAPSPEVDAVHYEYIFFGSRNTELHGADFDKEAAKRASLYACPRPKDIPPEPTKPPPNISVWLCYEIIWDEDVQ